ncbi:hypothetical protein Sa4125_17980 [Aureimonas sp. SA4125]|uniref:nucleoside phosphorylase n=1 Tax=Aureimonas sp. SA4125 TaxID=2826993 RepID=UPI001CC4ED6D|nr:nucleoside phosphorylase [Aureimonas sp. SA4125]BDA84256.1 hypothetical protein Sa4125_17980 [Aureimonas sp. SA4125]
MSAPSSPLLANKSFAAPSVFQPENLLREARRQKGLPEGSVPAICLLDPDGDIVRRLKAEGRSRVSEVWACYHTELHVFDLHGTSIGVVGCVVGAPFAVLVAEQLFASGCEFLVSITSAGQIAPLGPTPYFVMIAKSLRDEGTSHHYAAPADFAAADPALLARIGPYLAGLLEPIHEGATWTTDAPYRETVDAIEARKGEGIAAVEMEAAALYAFATARARPVLCFAHVTNQMAQAEGDFEKGEADGTSDALALLASVVRGWSETSRGVPR